MKVRVKVVYYINGAVKTDVLIGTDATVQRQGDSVDVMFPHDDGVYELTGNKSNEGEGGVGFVNYRRCDKFTRQRVDISTELS